MDDSTNPTELPVTATEEENLPIAKTEEEEEAAAPSVTESPKAQTANENPEEEQVPVSIPTEGNSSPPKPSSHKEEEVSVVAAEETTLLLIKEEVEITAADPVAVATEVPETSAPAPEESATVNGNIKNIAEANGEEENKESTRNITVVVAEKPQGKKEEESMPPEVDSVVVPPHWHAKPCLHVTSIGGFITEEFNMLSQASGWRTH